MEEIISVNSLTITKLNKLRKNLEKYQIKEIHNNLEIGDDVRIVYGAERHKINKKLQFKIELVRNKYYRQLKNAIELSTHRAAIEVFIDMESKNLNLDKYIFNSNKEQLKISLINYIGVYNFDNIFELSKDEMIRFKNYKCLNGLDDCIIELMGLFIPYSDKEEIIKILSEKTDKSIIDEIKKCRNFILICPEMIQEFCSKYYMKFKEHNIKDIFELSTIMINLVLIHEIGHGVFEYNFDHINDERRANYFVSLTFDGVFDRIIKVKTDIQGGLYKNPILLTDDEKIKEVKETIYSI